MLLLGGKPGMWDVWVLSWCLLCCQQKTPSGRFGTARDEKLIRIVSAEKR